MALRLPSEVLVVLIARENEYLVPGGGTTLAAGDGLLVLADEEAFREVEARIVVAGTCVSKKNPTTGAIPP
jgi:Trk K+ transport system NAD-binding subunit